MPFPFRHANGGLCCSAEANSCDSCKSKLAAEKLRINHHQEDNNMTDYTPPDSYAADLAKLRAASATPDTLFAERYAADRLRALDLEHKEIDAHIAAAPQPRLSAAEDAEFAPPDPYAAGIKALQLREAR
jgi:hypothetical protein